MFSTRSRKEADWRLILVVDVSGSMEASVIWSALTAAVLGGVPTLSTHFLAFSTEVIDLTDRVDDPLSLLLEVRVGGGTHIAAGLAHARSLVTVPSRTLVVVVSDFEEGYPLGGLLGEVRALAESGVHLLGCAALDDTGSPALLGARRPAARRGRHAGRRPQSARPRPLGGRPPPRRDPMNAELPPRGTRGGRRRRREPDLPAAQEAGRRDRDVRGRARHRSTASVCASGAARTPWSPSRPARPARSPTPARRGAAACWHPAACTAPPS